MNHMRKLSFQLGGEWVDHSFAPIFTEQTVGADKKRLVAGVPGGDPTVFASLVDRLEPPYFLLYILHTPRGEGKAGRYQSPELNAKKLHAFLEKFAPFLSADSRYDLWAYSPSDKATVVWERHNLIYAYDLLQPFLTTLLGLGFTEGVPSIPSPHIHHYREEFDKYAAELLSAFAWQCTPLEMEDEQ